MLIGFDFDGCLGYSFLEFLANALNLLSEQIEFRKTRLCALDLQLTGDLIHSRLFSPYLI